MATVWIWVCNAPQTTASPPPFNSKCSGGHYAQTFATAAHQPFAFDSQIVTIIVPALVSVLAAAWAIKTVRKVIK
jgi:hypothetical protein